MIKKENIKEKIFGKTKNCNFHLTKNATGVTPKIKNDIAFSY